MPFKRHSILTMIALALWIQPCSAPAAEAAKTNGNSVSGIKIQPNPSGGAALWFDYTFTGEPADAVFLVELPAQAGVKNAADFRSGPTPVLLRKPEPGQHNMGTSIQYPGDGTSSQVVVSIATAPQDGKVLASGRIHQVIKWPTQDEVDFQYGVASISNGNRSSLQEGRVIMERLIAKDPNFEPGYVQLARIAMSTNWGPEGIHQAETLLDSALKMRPDSANAKILLGYVYAHQQRYKDADALFADAARSNPPNLWLWTNWGQSLSMQGNEDQAIVKYREALRRPDTIIESLNARINAYIYLLALLRKRNDLDGMEAVYKQRIAELGPSSCFSSEYARFRLNVRGDAQGAIDLARAALNKNCQDAPSREVLGLASYVKWAQASGAESTEALNQARIYLPAGPATLAMLAESDRTLPAAKKMIANGEAIDQKDNEQMTALALALQDGKLDAAERLLRLGAHPDTPVGFQAMPVALLPVLEGNVEAIRVLKRAGVDYSKLRFQGATALDFAQQTGNKELTDALTKKDSAL